MLVYKNGEGKDILGFQCDMCDHMTVTDVIPNKHGEFRYICPKCGHHMKELMETNEEETKMVNTYTVENAAKRLKCSRTTICRAIHDGRLHDCFTETGYSGRPAWMIPCDQVEEWVTNGGFLQPRNSKNPIITPRRKMQKPETTRKVFDPEVGKEVPVVNFLGDTDGDDKLDEFMKRTVKRVAKNPKYVKVLDRTEEVKNHIEIEKPEVDLEAEMKSYTEKVAKESSNWGKWANQLHSNTSKEVQKSESERLERLEWIRQTMDREVAEKTKAATASPVVRTDGGFSITIPTEMIENMVQETVRKEIADKVSQLRTAFDLLNDELKKLEEVVA